MRATIGALAAVLALTLAGCAGGSGDPGLPPAPAPAEGEYNPQPYDNIRDGGTYTTAIGEINPQFNVLQGDSTADTRTLWRWSNAMPITFTPEGDPVFNPDYLTSATDETVDGNTRITYTINPAATFNDGTPMDWRIFENQARILSGKDPAYSVSSSDGYDRITSVTRGVDDRQAIVTFAGINLWWPGLFNEWLNPAVNTPELFNQGYLNNPHPEWGAGPYTIGKLDQQAGTVVFERNPKWWGKRGKLDSRTYVVYEAQASLNAFKNGQLDATGASSAERLAQVRDLPGIEIRRGTSPFTSLFTFNGESPILSDIAVRKALMQAIDRGQLGKILHQGLGYEESPPGSLTLYRFQDGYEDNFSKVVTFDPEAAKRGLDAAGWVPGPDGVRVKDGKPFVVEYVRTGDSPVGIAAATATAAMLKNVGVTMNIRAVQSSEFSSVVAERSFDLFFSAYSSSDPYGFAYFCQQWCSNSTLNNSKTGTPELDEKVRAVQALPTEAEVITQGNAVETEAFGRYGVMPIDNGPTIVAVKQGLANVGAGLFFVPLPETVGWQK
ncbi:MAG: ABC transporter family substrate-binding protein [Pseudonocardia sp.]